MHCSDEETLPYITAQHNVFWICFLVLVKATVSFEMSPTTHSTTQHYIQGPHNCETSNPIHHNITSQQCVDEYENYFSILYAFFTSQLTPTHPLCRLIPTHFTPCSSHQLTLCADSSQHISHLPAHTLCQLIPTHFSPNSPHQLTFCAD